MRVIKTWALKINACLDEKADHILMAIMYGFFEGTTTLIVFPKDQAPRRQQQFDYLNMTLGGSVREQSPTSYSEVQLNPRIKKNAHNMDVAISHCNNDGMLAKPSVGVKISACINEELRNTSMTTDRCVN
jgi:hypothetical protein